MTPPDHSTTATLRILATTDLHAQIWPHDYDLDAPTSGLGLARLATLIRAARAGAPNTLLFDNGDLFQGSQLGDDADRSGGQPHPMSAAMALVGYDAGTLGNHDFNYGLDTLEGWIGHLAYPLTLSNIVRRRGGTVAQDTPFLPPFLLLDRTLTCDCGATRDIRIGVIGAAPPQTLVWDRSLLEGRLVARGVREAIAAHLPALRASGADIVIALCHSGIGGPDPDEAAEDAALSVATLDGVDVIVAGHSHRRLPGPDHDGQPGVEAHEGRLAGKPAVLPGALGSDLGQIDLRLAHGDGGWRIAASESRLLPAGDTEPDDAILTALRPAHLRTRRASRRSKGRLDAPLHGLFPQVTHSPALQFAADAQSWQAARLLAGSAAATLPLLSAISPFKGGGPERPDGYIDIPAGRLRRGHLAELAPFPNALCVVAVSGRVLRLWLERAVSGFARIAAGARAVPLLRPDALSYNFDQIHGLRYRIDLTRPGWFDTAGEALDQTPDTARIVTLLTGDGAPVAEDDRFAVATNTYRAAGGGGFGFLADAPRVATAGHPIRDTLAGFAASRASHPGPLRHFWGFAPIDATAEVISAPWADAGLHGDRHRSLTPNGTDASGARRFLLDLSCSDLAA